MRHYNEQDLERCDRLIDGACDEILKQQLIIDQLAELDGLGPACDALDAAMEAVVFYQEERGRILEALRK